MSPTPIRPTPISLRDALRFWLRLGFISFGGPAGQIAIMHRELVEQKRWISERRFLHALNYCMLLPGPEAQQLATYLGWLMHGRVGGIAAGVLFVLPSLLILIALSYVYLTMGQLPAVAGFFYGIKPVVVALVAFAAWRIGTRTLRHPVLLAITIASFVALAVFDVYFPWIILSAALIGMLLGRLAPQVFSRGRSHDLSGASSGPAIIDDATPTPDHARFDWRRLVLVIVIGIGLWLGAMLALVGVGGTTGTLTQMGWFFTKAALLTFGGAYAVLPYVFQGAVEQHQWLTAAQMIDGLALGETTPGPLIMVVAFVGYIGGASRELIEGAPFLSGALAASVVTFFTFLPSFVFILAGGPLVESTRNDFKFTAPLTTITAAVVGVIAQLAVLFAGLVFFPAPGRFDAVALALALVAFVLLLRQRLNVIWVILGAGLMGVGLTLAGLVA